MSLAIQRAKYSGDPGLLGGILGGIGGFLTGGPAGAVAGAVGGWRGGGSQPARPQAGPGGLSLMGPPSNLPMRVPGPVGVAQRMLPGGASGYVCPTSGPPGPGYRLNKSDYFLRDGTFVPKGSRWVKVRRRNPANARATSRAISRVKSAKRYAKSLSSVTIREKK